MNESSVNILGYIISHCMLFKYDLTKHIKPSTVVIFSTLNFWTKIFLIQNVFSRKSDKWHGIKTSEARTTHVLFYSESFSTSYINIIACHKITLDIFVSVNIRNFASIRVNVADWQKSVSFAISIHAACCHISEVVS